MSFPTAFVVEPQLADSVFAISTLSSAGYRVTAADFREAKARLSFSPPHLLVVDVCQGAFNGLHLVIRGQAMRSRMAAVVTCRYDDIVLQRETERLGGAFLVKPTTRQEFLAAAARTVWRDYTHVEPIRAPFERRREGRRSTTTPIARHDRRRSERRRSVLLFTP